jgi:hypothetical protein
MRHATDYDTGEELGRASDRLAGESDAAVSGTNGVVLAWLTSDRLGAVWEYLSDSREADFVRMGADVRAVYVLP